ncbi:ankyrin repeat [Fusarium albosuccineum]|uniref:Ankyrin repeat n=1 Tax=Fusarium albosuccineum TaxID=1237068 RepID=A0A8H4PMG8_9HYPO|nr:ankyrin repeat [Fusarium albosuccineum]
MPNERQLLEIPHDLLAYLDHLFVVIDPIEQSDSVPSLNCDDVGRPRYNLLKVVEDLMTDIRFEKIQLLITSCPQEYIKATMSDISESISMLNPDVEEDVQLHVEARLQLELEFLDWPQNLRIP